MRGLRATAPCRTSKNDFHPYLLRAKIQDLLHALQLLAGTIIIPILQIETQTREVTKPAQRHPIRNGAKKHT